GGDLLPVVAARQHDLILFQILRADFDSKRNATFFPVIEFPSRTVLLAVVHFESDAGGLERKGEPVDGLHDALSLFRFSEYRNDDNLSGRKAWWNDDAAIVPVRHDQRADHACGETPTGGVDVFTSSLLCLEGDIECFGEILRQVMRGTGLQGLGIAHQGLDRVRMMRSGKFLPLCLAA